MPHPIEDTVFERLFLAARSHRAWQKEPVDEGTLVRLYELVRQGPTAMNAQPVRLLFVKSPEAKARLAPCLAPGNVEAMLTAPVTTIVGYDTEFHTHMARLAPHAPDMQARLAAMEPEAHSQMALQSATLQCGYLIIAARALGLDCGPVGGFDKQRLDTEFFPEGSWKSFLLVHLGHANSEKLHPRAPRLEFTEACRIV